MKEKFGNIVFGLLGPLVYLFIVLSIIGIFVDFSWLLSNKILPFASYVFWISFWICLFVALPLSLIRKTREFGLGLAYLMTFPMGILLWLYGFAYSYIFVGPFWTVLLLFIVRIGVVPIAIVALIFHGLWFEILNIIFLFVVTFGLRILIMYLGEREL